MDGKYIPSGELQGDTSPLPYRGCESGCQGDSHGVELSGDATQSMGTITADTRSDAPNARHRSGEYDGHSSGNSPGNQFNGTLGSARGE